MKRESISLSNRGKKDKGLTKAGLRKKLAAERKSLKAAQTEQQQIDSSIKAKLDESENVGMELEKSSNGYSSLEDEANQLQKAINNSLYEKQRNLDLQTKLQRHMRRFRELEEPSTNDVLSNTEVSKKLEGAEQLYSSTQEVIASLGLFFF